jgi:hypothetical protein
LRAVEVEIAEQGVYVLLFGKLPAALEGIEVAVRTLTFAPGEVDVERERR